MEEVTNKTVIALKSFSTGTISMFKGEIREMDADMAETLIDNGLVAEYVPDVPAVGANDKDKYLHTNAETGDKEWSNVPSELPTVGSSDKNKYLHTNAETGEKEWTDVPSELPTVTGTDEGKVLTVNNSGVWVASMPSSGGGVLAVQTTTLSETLVSGVLPNVDGYSYSSSHEEGTLLLTVTGVGDMDIRNLTVTIGTYTYTGEGYELDAQDANTLQIKLKDEQMYPESAILGLSITVARLYTALDHTWQEIVDAPFAVWKDVNIEVGYADVVPITAYQAGDSENPFFLAFGTGDDSYTFTATSATDYPVMQNNA